jgi:hypothetical protein
VRVDVESGGRLVVVCDVGGRSQRRIRHADVADETQDAQLETLELLARRLANPAGPLVHSGRERIRQRFPILPKVEAHDVRLPRRESEQVLPRPADQERRMRPLNGLGPTVEARDRIEPTVELLVRAGACFLARVSRSYTGPSVTHRVAIATATDGCPGHPRDRSLHALRSCRDERGAPIGGER